MRQTLIVMSRHIEFDLKNEVFRQYENLSQNFTKRIVQEIWWIALARMFQKWECMLVPQWCTPSIRLSVLQSSLSTCTMSPLVWLYIRYFLLPLLSYGIFKLSSEINKRSTVFQYLWKYRVSPKKYFQVSDQGLFTRRPAPKQHGVLAKKAKEKFKLSQSTVLFGPLMLALIGISNPL
jgi:ATP-binding cassette subfamily B protein